MIASIAVDQSIAIQNWIPAPRRRVEVDVDVEEWSHSTIGLYRKFVLDTLRQAESSVISATAFGAEYQQTAKAPHITMSEAQRQAAIQLIDQWLADDSGYDEQVWPILKETIEENRLSYRKRFDE